MKHLILPDAQTKAGVPLEHLEWAGRYIVDKKPDVVVNIGDFADMPSLSSYDVGKRQFEGRRYHTDIETVHHAMELLLGPIVDFNEKARKSGHKQYKPRMVLTLGNHEHRIQRAVDSDAKLDGTIGMEDLQYKEYGWEVYPFLDPVVIDGVAYCHYFTSGIAGRPVTSAATLLTKRHQSAVMGHVQQRQIAYANKADGSQLTAIFSGSFYQHDEEYLNAQGNKHWRGLWVLHEVNNGEFDEMPVSLGYLKRKYG